ncbi:nucleoside diphosphate kinase regulator [Gilvimarinus agarilyticus]|uniref:nucleoside diphosphate kinase regulator n=1 Tax=unclassified Gilvimarinus TaxID=2642066 RepID=UPI001C08C016|nr:MULTISPECIES: nucleoside diphosphate kinase regulator [unclassified Gilvimarinus]MBU2886692.1 nucleoside diphosphate kinase regulator [Gilvimarinus agarilyticus]MDO6571359.1 nucleoside diphosphate kinase regulator [Gilvimarinus sp. 2_MG-2023]MDO6746224.1 nucleoside diphosphate kinase regulator [Gilvimarinus sp. 1_MG-2023]
MAKKPKLVISKVVYQTLSTLLDSMPEDMITEQLLDELERARLVVDDKLPHDIVTMHSLVTFTVQSTGKTFTYTLVYPQELNDTSNQLSILSPVGSAIIGLQAGSKIDWAISPSNQTTIFVEKVLPPSVTPLA